MQGILPVRDLAQLFEYTPGIHFWIKDAAGRFQAANLAFVKHFGLKAFRDMEGKTDFDLHPFAFAQEYSLDDRSVLQARRILANKMELVSGLDGSIKWYSTTKIPLRDGRGEWWATAGFTRMVSPCSGEAGPGFPAEPGSFAGSGLTGAVDRIQRGFAEALDVPALAALAGLSVTQFERNFRKVMKETPSRYIHKTRMRAACQLLLRSDLPIAEVARRSGYPDANYFAKRFFLYLHISPSAYRRKFRPRLRPDRDRPQA